MSAEERNPAIDSNNASVEAPGSSPATLKLFLSGDVMTGRGVDQALPVSVDPVLHESYIKNALDYLRLAERQSGEIPVPVDYDYIWGDARAAWASESPDLRLINLETSITTHDRPWPGKGIHYRMHPDNVEVLSAAGIDYCSLANNHTLDWSRPGLDETLAALEATSVEFAGAGASADEARAPAILPVGSTRVLVFSYGTPGSGIRFDWAAQGDRSGVNLLPTLDDSRVSEIGNAIDEVRRDGDIVVFSVHWGGNWGYDVPAAHRSFAHRLIDEAGVDVIHGHSSHHPMGIEVYRDRLILYGAGDFINDYEGIGGRERYRGELALMYFPVLDIDSGALRSLKMVPMEIRNLRLNRAADDDARWLQELLSREGESLGKRAALDESGAIVVDW